MRIQPQSYYQDFIKLGLTAKEAEVYFLLLKEGSLSAKDIAKNLNIFPNAVYRIAVSLQKNGLITPLNVYPMKYQAIIPEIALDVLVNNKEKELEQTKSNIISALTSSNNKHPAFQMVPIASKEEMFSAYIEMANSAQKEILILSIGEQVSDDVLITNRTAKDRGVVIKILIQKYDKTNRNLIQSYIKMEWQVRLCQESGFHLIISDKERAVLMVNNPKETKERSGMRIYNKGLIHALSDYFLSVWKSANIIS